MRCKVRFKAGGPFDMNHLSRAAQKAKETKVDLTSQGILRVIGEVAKLFADAGLVVMCSFISPFRAERRMVRELLENDEFVEVFVDASIEECKRRDPKGLYAKTLAGKVKNFTGIDSPYEPPENAGIHLVTENVSADAVVDQILEYLRVKGRI